jgi:hypothetical protein
MYDDKYVFIHATKTGGGSISDVLQRNNILTLGYCKLKDVDHENKIRKCNT